MARLCQSRPNGLRLSYPDFQHLCTFKDGGAIGLVATVAIYPSGQYRRCARRLF